MRIRSVIAMVSNPRGSVPSFASRGGSTVAAAALVVVAAIGVLGSAALVDAGVPANASPPAARGASGLQRGVDLVRESGSTSVLGVYHGDQVRRARVGTTTAGGTRPIPWNEQVRIGSVTKTFIATVMLQLVAEDRLSLNDTVERWLPGVVRGHGNDGTKITVRQLLQHTSGLFNYDADPAVAASFGSDHAFGTNRFHSYTARQLVAVAMSHPPNFRPGTRWSYSNTNYLLAGMIIEKATGRDWGTEVTDRIVAPLKLRHTYAPGNDPFIPGPHPHGYEQFADSQRPTDVTVFNPSLFGAAGAMVSTAHDLDLFWRALIQGQLLPAAQKAEMQTTVPASGAPGARYGLGIYWLPLSCGLSGWGHPGSVPGFNTLAGISSDGRRSIVVFATGPGGNNTESVINQVVDRELCTGG